MKKLLWFISFFLVGAGINAQNYTVGVPVDDTIGTITFLGGNNCLPDYDFSMDFPPSTVTGVEHILIFANVSPTDSVYTIPGGTINTGDTLFFTPFLHIYYYYFHANGEIDCVFKAIGTPLIANESYYCGIWWWDNGGLVCMNHLHCYFSGVCTVSDITSVKETAYLNKEAWISPNPATTHINLQLPPQFEQATKIEVYDRIGQLLLRMSYTAEVDVCSLSAGLYYLVVSNEDGERVTGRFVKEQ
jgi:hypothetical protein